MMNQSQAKTSTTRDNEFSLRRKREEYTVEIRQHKRVEEFTQSRMRRQPQDENSASRQDLEELEKMKKHIDTCLTRTFTVNDFYDLAKLINSEDLYDQHLGVIGLRKILAKKLDMPIQDVIDANLIPRLMSFMKQDEHVHLQVYFFHFVAHNLIA
eukprot:TRINITY_DN3638_c0_g1_i5.p1 TRINITY_DN3638_c0_g1~~TRINITY_DN3638_c0_g1_i5.p1  ORF type:complete len:155 (+),score=34.55 TRINITY_DN3638_c0_g1_i5:64-528(+)